LLAEQTRSGLTETYHDGAFAAVDSDLRLIAWSGDIDRPFYLRSSGKPFQAFVGQEAGAGLTRQELALACSSHDGLPAHVAMVGSMLDAAGLDESNLGCPPSWPNVAARDLLVAAGERKPRRIWHNCSGKHAGWLRACVASGWDIGGYLEPTHPLQKRVRDLVTDLGGFDVGPVGVDGCGAPVLRTTVRAMASMYARLAGEPRFEPVFNAMHAYPALVSGVGNGDALIATALHAAAKRGAAGCLGAAVAGQLGVAAKSWDGNDLVAAHAVAQGLSMVLTMTPAMSRALQGVRRPEIFGGGEQVGFLESRLQLQRA
jgi:L-asparaginase II